MSIRYVSNPIYEEKEITEKVDKMILRSYQLLFVGIIVKILKVQISKTSVAGVEFSIDGTLPIAGLFFLATIACELFVIVVASYYLAFGLGTLGARYNMRRFLRSSIIAARKDKNVANKILYAKRRARNMYLSMVLFGLVVWSAPAIYILVFEMQELISAITVVF